MERDDVRRNREEGAVAIVAAISLTAMLLMAAFVIDLGALRADRASSQTVSDMAATAAAGVFGETDSYEDGCVAGFEYAISNLRGLSTTTAALEAACVPLAGACTPTTPARTATFTLEMYTITVKNPVPDDDLRIAQQTVDTAIDGRPCDRFGVEVVRTRDFIFGGLAGSFSGSTQRGAVARVLPEGDEGVYASLIVLHRDSCQTLVASGGPSGGGIVVEGAVYDGEYHPGVITVDSVAPSCGGNSEIIDLDGSNSQILADELYSHALDANGDTPANRANVHPDVPATRLTRPEAGPVITRAPVDHLYNCLATYGSQVWSPAATASVSSSTPCGKAAERPAYLRQLHDKHAGLTSAPTGWTVISDCSPNNAVTITGANVFVDCAGGYSPKDLATFSNVEHVVFRGDMSATGATGGVRIVGSSSRGATVVVRGHVSFGSQQSLTVNGAFVYLPTGRVNIGGQATVSWTAPSKTLEPVCDAYDGAFNFAAPNLSPVPPGACFAPLGLWTNSADSHNLKGGGGVTVIGSFFTPNADSFNLVGGSGQNLDKAQFFAGKLRVDGGGNVRMIASPDTTIPIPLDGGLRLIR